MDERIHIDESVENIYLLVDGQQVVINKDLWRDFRDEISSFLTQNEWEDLYANEAYDRASRLNEV